MSKKTVAELLVERLMEWGVDTIFSLPGDGINGIYEVLRVHEKHIKLIQVRHEEAAAFAACAYAKYSGRLGVCLATSGPGGVHLLNGLYDAKFDGQPVLAITGHTFHDLIGTHYKQDLDLDKLFMDVAAYNQRIMGPSHVHNVVDEAIKTALSQRAVAHINIAKDIQGWEMDGQRSGANTPAHSADIYKMPRPVPSQEELNAAAVVINEGQKVVILVGQGALDARKEVLALAAMTQGVIIKALLGKAVVPDDSVYTTGGLGLLGTAPSAEAMQEADTLMMVGTSFPYLEFYPKQDVRTVQIDIDSTRIGLRHRIDVGLTGDCRETLRSLLKLLKQKEDQTFLQKSQERMKQWKELLQEQGTRMDRPLKPQVVAFQLSALIERDCILCVDTGTVTAWAARHIILREEMKFSLSGNLSSMANGLSYAIGAAMALPGRQIICLCGDGGFSMLMGELATIAKYHLPVKVIIFKNNAFGMIKWEQIVFEGNPEYGTELHPIDFAMFARSCGIAGFTLDDPAIAQIKKTASNTVKILVG
ncbi:MAG: pyruvate oxidase, partial [Candidatus Omnitrophica bacterium]|nr:pyruvate oxidase [Candidatus Omnitrophota bacterium]